MKKIQSILLMLVFLSYGAYAENGNVKLLQKQWSNIKYNITDSKQQEKQIKALSNKALEMVSKQPSSAEIKIWAAIIMSTQAGIKGGLSGLSLVKKSKKLLEDAILINPNALQGSAYTSLGSLYYQVPGWPIGFGSDKKAREHLEKALTINPNGIDSNYFYGDFLSEEGEYKKALKVLYHALSAPKRIDRELADKGRISEIKIKIEEVKANLNKDSSY